VFRELQLDVDETASIIDGTIVRAHQDASGGKGGSNRMLWDALEEVFRPKSTRSSTRKGGRSTSRWRRESGMNWSQRPSSSTTRAAKPWSVDTGYDSNELRAELEMRGIKAVISSKPERKRAIPKDRRLYRKRYLVELFFHSLKRFRGVATRFDKTRASYLALIHVACILLWLN
jgi:transposase